MAELYLVSAPDSQTLREITRSYQYGFLVTSSVRLETGMLTNSAACRVQSLHATGIWQGIFLNFQSSVRPRAHRSRMRASIHTRLMRSHAGTHSSSFCCYQTRHQLTTHWAWVGSVCPGRGSSIKLRLLSTALGGVSFPDRGEDHLGGTMKAGLPDPRYAWVCILYSASFLLLVIKSSKISWDLTICKILEQYFMKSCKIL